MHRSHVGRTRTTDKEVIVSVRMDNVKVVEALTTDFPGKPERPIPPPYVDLYVIVGRS